MVRMVRQLTDDELRSRVEKGDKITDDPWDDITRRDMVHTRGPTSAVEALFDSAPIHSLRHFSELYALLGTRPPHEVLQQAARLLGLNISLQTSTRSSEELASTKPRLFAQLRRGGDRVVLKCSDKHDELMAATTVYVMRSKDGAYFSIRSAQ